MRVVVNMENARSFEPAEPGPYPLVIKAMGNPEKKEKSTIIEVEFQFEDPEMDRACGTITRMYPIDGKGAGFFRDFWKAATGQELPVGQAGIAIDTDDAIGRHVIGDVANREYQGKLYNEVKSVVAAQ